MKIYIGHPSSIDFKESLYRPLENSELAEKHNLIFPHKDSDEPFDSKNLLRGECDLMVAEVSEPSTGLGIELGWAEMFEVPTVLAKRNNVNVSSSLSVISDEVLSYEDKEELIEVLRNRIGRIEE